jgi:hypothetical protein
MQKKEKKIKHFKECVLDHTGKKTYSCSTFGELFTATFFQRRFDPSLDFISRIRIYLCHKNTLAIKGFGGIGKTTLVKYYEKEAKAIGWYDFIFHIECENLTVFTRSVKDLFDYFLSVYHLIDDSCSLNEQYAYLKENLSLKAQNILLIFDNVQDDVFYAQWVKPLTQKNFHCLLTTRHLNEVNNTLYLGNFTSSQSKSYMENFFKEHNYIHEEALIPKVADCVQHLPLAIGQIAHFVVCQFPKMSLSTLLERFEAKKKIILDHVDKDNEHHQRIIDHLSLYISYSLSREALSEDAKTLLDLFCFLYSENIPYYMLKYFFVTNFNKRLEDSWIQLRDFGLIKISGADYAYKAEIHRLYQEVGRIVVDEDGDFDFDLLISHFDQACHRLYMYVEDEIILTLSQKIKIYHLLENVLVHIDTFILNTEENEYLESKKTQIETIMLNIWDSIQKDPSAVLLEKEEGKDQLVRQHLKLSKEVFQRLKEFSQHLGFVSYELDDLVGVIRSLYKIDTSEDVKNRIIDFFVHFLPPDSFLDDERLRCLEGIMDIHHKIREIKDTGKITWDLIWHLQEEPYHLSDIKNKEELEKVLWQYVYSLIEEHKNKTPISILLKSLDLSAPQKFEITELKSLIIKDIIDESKMRYENLDDLLKESILSFSSKEKWDDVFLHIRKLPLRRFLSGNILSIVRNMLNCSAEKRQEISNLFYVITEYMYRHSEQIPCFIILMKRTERATCKMKLIYPMILPTMGSEDIEQFLKFFNGDEENKIAFLKSNMRLFPKPDKHFSGSVFYHLLQYAYKNQQNIENVIPLFNALFRFDNQNMNDHYESEMITALSKIKVSDLEKIVGYTIEILNCNPDRDAIIPLDRIIQFFGKVKVEERENRKNEILHKIKESPFQNVICQLR